jgi:hypothetical protein
MPHCPFPAVSQGSLPFDGFLLCKVRYGIVTFNSPLSSAKYGAFLRKNGSLNGYQQPQYSEFFHVNDALKGIK